MIHSCKNCDQPVNGKFCHHCGQTANVRNLNWDFLWYEIQNNFIQFDKGVLYTSKALLTRPGYAVREFIEGKRVNHYKPVALVLLLATIYVLLYHYFKIDLSDGSRSFVQGMTDGSIAGTKKSSAMANYGQIMEWANTHYSEQSLMQIPLFALGIFVFLEKLATISFNFLCSLLLLLHRVYWFVFCCFRFYRFLKITNIICRLYHNLLRSFFRFGRTFSFSIHTPNSKC